ncbi:methoxymalonate biosynthesis protein [Frankia sp. AiPs1]|uniref:HAD-IIIC family phosphatase n=1 Tax=Frankia sp. AiPa1 TaxID=573492 RepID=UPI00202B0675|nr:HAD-IIIC family phosphatase [Frankia sp. AiPa1]MCL9759485.1 HAD-IIIC family phosphatase [Frankia sp. AiPa1]
MSPQKDATAVSDTKPLVKCLVWDLDNTLWQGTLLEDGPVRLTSEIRDVIVELDSRGILQSIASRNDHDHAWARLEDLGVAEYFVAPKIGWGRKSDSVAEIVADLNIGANTVAFIDDMPVERAEVAHHHPDVRCYPAEEAAKLAVLPEFSPAVVTVDARRRRQMYQASFQRDAARSEHQGPDEDFLRTLDLVLRIGRARDEEISRVEELTMRTNQMNATGVHYSDATLRELIRDPAHEVLVPTLVDTFGPHGAIGVLLLQKSDRVWHLKLLATSCRVVAFGVGAMLLRWLTDRASRAGVHLVADFRRTDRNRMMEVAYRFAGFVEADCACLAALPAADGVERLHLTPVEQPAPDTMRVLAADLGAPGHDLVAWS